MLETFYSKVLREEEQPVGRRVPKSILTRGWKIG